MDLVVKGRRGRVSDHTRQLVERKVARMSRREPRLERVEVEFIEQPNPRVDGGHRVEASCRIPRRSFRAQAAGGNLDAVVDQVLSRLQRQVAEYERRRRARLIDGANKVKSRQIMPDAGSPMEPPPG